MRILSWIVTAVAGGTNSHTFAEDGEVSYSHYHPILVFPSFVHTRTPVADMLAHSPPLPLVINFFDDDRDITGEDEKAVILALQQRDRIRRVSVLALDLQKFVIAMEKEYPILECLIMGPLTNEEDSVSLMFPTTFQAPCLRHLVLASFALPRASSHAASNLPHTFSQIFFSNGFLPCPSWSFS
jgi:hypothetical protein